MEAGPIATVVGLLGACLVALILVLVARREAAAQRSRAAEDVSSIKEDARTLLADVERRERRVVEREAAVSAERDVVEELEAKARGAVRRGRRGAT